MPNQLQSILRQSTRYENEKLNILTFLSDEQYDIGLYATGHRFFIIDYPGSKKWLLYNGQIPKNCQILVSTNNRVELPSYRDYDIVIAHDKGAQFNIAQQLSEQFGIPLIVVEHTIPISSFTVARIRSDVNKCGKLNILIASSQRTSWYLPEEYKTIINHPCINTQIFKPSCVEREDYILWIGDDVAIQQEECGFNIMKHVTGFPLPMMKLRIVGNNPGLSKVPESLAQLIDIYSKAGVYLNTCLNSPLPTNMLLAMACGCPVVSLPIGDVNQIIQHGQNGFIASDLEAMRDHCSTLLHDKKLAINISKNAHETIRKKCGVARFIQCWHDILNQSIKENQ